MGEHLGVGRYVGQLQRLSEGVQSTTLATQHNKPLPTI
jgi:hypothetical protein